jgi:hypothetical protein
MVSMLCRKATVTSVVGFKFQTQASDYLLS